jgi:hypothetical protein
MRGTEDPEAPRRSWRLRRRDVGRASLSRNSRSLSDISSLCSRLRRSLTEARRRRASHAPPGWIGVAEATRMNASASPLPVPPEAAPHSASPSPASSLSVRGFAGAVRLRRPAHSETFGLATLTNRGAATPRLARTVRSSLARFSRADRYESLSEHYQVSTRGLSWSAFLYGSASERSRPYERSRAELSASSRAWDCRESQVSPNLPGAVSGRAPQRARSATTAPLPVDSQSRITDEG